MSIDLQDFKIPTFAGINRNPVAPTATKAGNGSHLVQQYNGLVDKVQDSISTNWIIIDSATEPYQISSSQKIVNFDYSGSSLVLKCPESPTPGTFFIAMNTNPAVEIEITNYGFRFNGQTDIQRVYFTAELEPILFLYTGDDRQGWISTHRDLIQLQGPVS